MKLAAFLGGVTLGYLIVVSWLLRCPCRCPVCRRIRGRHAP